MLKLEMMLVVLLILPLFYFDAGGQVVQRDWRSDGLARYLQRGDRDVRECNINTPGSSWGKCCLTRMCGPMCCARSGCTCVYHWRRGHGCSCPG
uniref:Alpha-conotoxin-like Ms20.1 n=1 Tax=Conus mustelinus TaxID=101309 RepID=CXAT1_CONMS|nr:RecName: Full=Alpha-conotoxin-like Ms20.1; AltName: Full=MsXXA; Flags: Precursor [Conus mustelinus]CAX51121.1 msXXA precursor [Conus mustelinus]